MDDTFKVYLIRHGETLAQVSGIFSGRSDFPLTEKGLIQASALCRRPDISCVDTIFSSPLKRCVETAGEIFCQGKILKGAIVMDENLEEIDFGDWEMKTWGQISLLWPEEAEKWLRQEEDFHFPGGEGVKDFYERMKTAASNIKKFGIDGHSGPVAVVAHGGVIRSLICIWLGLPMKHLVNLCVDIASVSRVTITRESGVLDFLNDGSHLKQIPGAL